MKKIVLFLLLLFSGAVSAQAIVVPDADFMAKLLASDVSNTIAKDSSGDPIKIDANNDGVITEEEAEEVRELNVSACNISSLAGIEYFVDLRILNCSNNTMGGTLNMNAVTDLRELNCSGNQLTALQVLGLDHLEVLNCSNNQLTDIDVSDLGYLADLTCSNNALTTIDLNTNTSLASLVCSDNQLVTLFVKNGANEYFDPANWSGNPTLEYICADEFQVGTIQEYSSLPETTQVNSYCSYEPGGVYNSVVGVVKYDANNNGSCSDSEDYVVPSFRLKITGGTDNYEDEVFTRNDGTYVFYVKTGVYTVEPVFEESYFTFSASGGSVDFQNLTGVSETRDFCIHKTAENHPDVEVVIAPLTDAQPGMNAVYKMVYKNKGNQVVNSGSVTCLWDSARFTYVGTDTPIDIIGVNTYTWNYTYLKPFEAREINMELTVNSATDNPPVNVGDVLEFGMTINPGTDDLPGDNSFEFRQPVVGALTSNGITCVEGNVVSPDAIGDYLHYVVNFENTGTALPDFAVVETDIDTNAFDIASLRLVNSSEKTSSRIAANRVTFRFEEFSVASDGKGNLLYKIKTRSGLMAGSSVISAAKVFFDYNAPVQTNDAETTFALLSTGEFAIDSSVKMYPNPSKGIVKIEADASIRTIYLYDIQGRQLEAALINENNFSLDVSHRAVGIYFVKIITEKGTKVEKLIRE